MELSQAALVFSVLKATVGGFALEVPVMFGSIFRLTMKGHSQMFGDFLKVFPRLLEGKSFCCWGFWEAFATQELFIFPAPLGKPPYF